MTCSHYKSLRITPPKLSQQVHKEECTRCFENQDSKSGIDVCLSCFNGSCNDDESDDRRHALVHSQKSGHDLAVNIKRVRKERPERVGLHDTAHRDVENGKTYLFHIWQRLKSLVIETHAHKLTVTNVYELVITG
jgi:hypothetical protein